MNNIELNIIEKDITIKQRNYNGDYGKGSVFDYNIYLKLKQIENYNQDALGFVKVEIVFCINEILGGDNLASITNELPLIINNDNRIKVNNIVNVIISNPNYKYNETHYSKDRFDPKKLRYYDVIIDKEEFEVPTDDKNIIELLEIFEYKKVNEYIKFNYKNMLEK